MTITICSSTTFYKDVLAVEQRLMQAGYTVLVPEGVEIMKTQKNFDPDSHKASYLKKKDYKLKQKLIDLHIEKIKKADAVLIVNNEKKGIQGYIGGNVLIEMAVAYVLKKQIYLWNDISDTHPFADEIYGLHPRMLQADISRISSI